MDGDCITLGGDAKGVARDLTEGLVALGQAHERVCPVLGQQKRAAPLGDLLAVLLAAYDDKGIIGSRIQVSVPDILVRESAITAMALVVHELATNSLKYGALSTEAGSLDVRWSAVDNEMVLVWTERGGPPVSTPTGQAGFGSVLVKKDHHQEPRRNNCVRLAFGGCDCHAAYE